MNRSLNLRINLIIIIVITSVLAIFGVINYQHTKVRKIAELKQRVEDFSEQFSLFLGSVVWNMDSVELKNQIKIAMKTRFIYSITYQENLDNDDSAVKSNFIKFFGMRRDKEWNPVILSSPTDFDNDMPEVVHDITKKKIKLGELHIVYTQHFLEEELYKSSIFWIVNMCGLTLVIIITLIFLIKTNVTKPISVLKNEFKKVVDGDFNSKLILTRNDELTDMYNSFIYMREVVKDKIEELREAQKNSEYLRYYLKTILDSMPSILVGVDLDGVVTHWNKAAVKYTNNLSDDVIGYDLKTALPDLNDVIDDILDSIKAAKSHYISKHCVLRDGVTKYVDITVYPLSSESINGAVIRIDDVTEKCKIDKLIIQTEKMTSVAGLAAGMAHEINNPLSIITQGIQNIQRRLSPSSPKNIEVARQFNIDLNQLEIFLNERKITTFLEGGKKAVERAAEIVRNMLKFARKSDASQTRENIVNIIEHTISLSSTDYNLKKNYDFKFIDIIKNYEPDIPDIVCCSGEIEQVFLNLFKNAIQAMEDVVDDLYIPKLYINVSRISGYVRIEIIDNGPGMPENIKNRIFEPFFTTKAAGIGTGLGLSVSYMIITQNHNGTFEVESELGKGTKFIIQLPV